MTGPMKGYVYRHFDGSGRLLYIGSSENVLKRTSGHRARSSWWMDIRRIEIEHYPSVAAAKAAEWDAISAEGPIYNILSAEYVAERVRRRNAKEKGLMPKAKSASEAGKMLREFMIASRIDSK